MRKSNQTNKQNNWAYHHGTFIREYKQEKIYKNWLIGEILLAYSPQVVSRFSFTILFFCVIDKHWTLLGLFQYIPFSLEKGNIHWNSIDFHAKKRVNFCSKIDSRSYNFALINQTTSFEISWYFEDNNIGLAAKNLKDQNPK